MTPASSVVRAEVGRLLGVPAESVALDRPFSELGLDSARLLTLAAELEQRLGVTVEADRLFEFPTVRELGAHVASMADTSPPTTTGAPVVGQRAVGTGTGVAIVGMACRFPGADDTDELWRMLLDGHAAITDPPPDRWEEVRDATPSGGGWAGPFRGGFISGIDRFDAAFFGLTPQEARLMDPQQRLLLELTWRALEDAGVPPGSLRGTGTGVFVGISNAEYAHRLLTGPGVAEPAAVTGSSLAVAANRISYVFDLRGPSLAVDTACSSSLVAVHLGVEALERGDCDVALVGGANLLVEPHLNRALDRAGMLAADGRCKTFDARADGYTRGEGGAIVVLRRLDNARLRGERIYAVIEGTAVTQDGRSNGLTAPNPVAQRAVLGAACERAGVSPALIDYVECHGTGTALGDPIEARSVGAVIGTAAGRSGPCLVGSVKTNIGHLEAAAGVAGLVKTALALHHGELPATVGFDEPNPHIDFDQLGLEVVAGRRPWPRPERRAGVSSFGFGGTNAHAVVRSVEAVERPVPVPSPWPAVLPLSARSEEGLGLARSAWADRLAATPAPLPDLLFTAAAGRDHLRPWRDVIVADSPDELAAAVSQPAPAASRPASPEPVVALVFPGQGSAHRAMGSELAGTDRLFRSALGRAGEILEPLLGLTIDELLADELADTALGQPALCAVQHALAELWRRLGLVPGAVVGHSVGEITAAIVSGAIGLEDGLRFAVERGRVMAESPPGSMLAVAVGADEAASIVAATRSLVEVAALNGPKATVLSGPADDLAEVVEELRRRRIAHRSLGLPYAFHSRIMDGSVSRLAREMTPLRVHEPRLPLYSSVLGRRVGAADLDPGHWLRNVREPVRFQPAVEDMVGNGVTCLLEIGPRPVLRSAMIDTCRQRPSPPVVVAGLDAQDETRGLVDAMAALFRHGVDVRWDRLQAPGARIVSAPGAPWVRDRHWIDRAPSAPPSTGLPGAKLDLAGAEGQHVWQTTVDFDSFPFLADHRVDGVAVLPAALHVELLLAVAAELGAGGTPLAVDDLELLAPATVPGGGALRLQTAAQATGDQRWACAIHAGERSGEWTLVARAEVGPWRPDTAPLALEVGPGAERMDRNDLYDLLRSIGLDYGPEFRRVSDVLHDGDRASASVDGPSSASGTIDCRVLDSSFHLLGTILDAATSWPAGGVPVPARVGRIHLAGRPTGPYEAVGRVRSTGTGTGTGAIVADVQLVGDDGSGRLEVHGLRLEPVHRRHGRRHPAFLYTPRWQADRDGPAPARPTGSGTEMLVIGGGALARRLVVRRAELGDRPTHIVAEEALVDHAEIDRQVRMAAARGCRTVVYVGQRDAMAEHGSGPVDWLSGLVAVLGAMAGSTWSGGSPELHLLTVGSQRLRPDGSDIDHPAGALGWGLLKAVPFELPTIAYRCVDVVDDVDVDLLWGELTRDSNDAEIALRDGHRHVRRLVAGQPPEGAPAVELVRPGGAYVIAGGTGGIGRELARHLVAAGATRLALLGRSASAATGLARELQAGGATVDLLDVDLADAGGLDAALDLVRRHGEIRGVAHAAGVLADGALRDMTRADVATVLRAKVDGTCNLDRATDGDDLDWFVLFSSAAGVLGSPGQANYAAANAYLDAFAHLRQRRGRPVTVVDWGPWAETGMAAGSRLAERMESRTAATALAPADALSVLDDLVRCGAGQTVAVAFDLRNLLQFFPLGRSASFFQELRTADVDQLNSIGRASRHGRPALRAPYRVPAGPVEERIAAIWEVSLGIAPIGADDDFFELGGDSVFGNQIVAEVNRELGIAIDAAEAFDAFTVANLAALAEAEGARLVGALTDDEARALLGAREAGDG